MADRKPVTPERAAQMAAASKRYRARQKAARLGTRVPPVAARMREAAYHPPRVPRGERAAADATAARNRRAERIAELPQARNPRQKIFVPRQSERAAASNKRKSAAAIRANEAAKKLQAGGRRWKNDLLHPQEAFGSVHEKLDRSDQVRFEALMHRMAKHSNQTLAVYFNYEGGGDEMKSAIESILYPPKGATVEDGFDRLKVLATALDSAEQLYGPAAVGRIAL